MEKLLMATGKTGWVFLDDFQDVEMKVGDLCIPAPAPEAGFRTLLNVFDNDEVVPTKACLHSVV
jgi:hypothetical protein